MNRRYSIVVLVVLLIAALACSPGGGGDAPDAGGKAPDGAGDASDASGDGPNTEQAGKGGNNESGPGQVGAGGKGGGNEGGGPDTGNQGKGQGGDGPGGGDDFELSIDEATLEAALTAAMQQAGYLGEDDSATVDIRSDETILTSFPYTVEETGTEVTAELVYTVFLGEDGSVGVDLISATFTTEEGIEVDVPEDRVDEINATIETTLASYSSSAAAMGVTLTDIVYSDTDMKLEGSVAP